MTGTGNCRMKTLLLMRHAKSSWSDHGLDDHERPLNDRGERDAPRMGRWMAEQDFVPDLIIASTATRASQTAAALQRAAGYAGDIMQIAELYHAGVPAWTAVLRQIPDHVHSVLAIGHNPGLEELVDQLHHAWERMPTAAVAWFELPLESWIEFSPSAPATLRLLQRPRELQD